MRRTLATLALATTLTGCAAAPSLPSAAPSSAGAPSSVAPATVPVTLPSGSTLQVPSAWAVDTSGPSAGRIRVGGADPGFLTEYDVRSWAPDAEPGPGSLTAAQIETVRSILAQLAEDGTVSPTLARRIAAEDTGTLISYRRGDVRAIQPLLTGRANLVGFSSTGSYGQAPGLWPIYTAVVYDRDAGRLLVGSWEIDGAEPLLRDWATKQRAAEGDPAQMEQVDRAAHAWFDEFLDATPRSRLSWGEQLQVLDEALSSYRPPR